MIGMGKRKERLGLSVCHQGCCGSLSWVGVVNSWCRRFRAFAARYRVVVERS